MNRAQASAHAKAVLIGEHFVLPAETKTGPRLPGTPALVIPIPGLLTRVELSLAAQPEFEATAPGFTMNPQARSLMQASLERAAEAHDWNLDARPLLVSAESSIPISRGFGSSAAFSVALCRA